MHFDHVQYVQLPCPLLQRNSENWAVMNQVMCHQIPVPLPFGFFWRVHYQNPWYRLLVLPSDPAYRLPELQELPQKLNYLRVRVLGRTSVDRASGYQVAIAAGRKRSAMERYRQKRLSNFHLDIFDSRALWNSHLSFATLVRHLSYPRRLPCCAKLLFSRNR